MTLKRSVIGFGVTLVVELGVTVSQTTTCTTNGGYDSGKVCVSECFELEATLPDLPYFGAGTPPAEPTKNLTSWCATTDEYDAISPGVRKLWGYCDCITITNEPTASPTIPTPLPTVSPTEWKAVATYYADGAGVGLNDPEAVNEDGLQECVLPFTYIAPDGTASIHESCESIADFPPFLGNGGAFPPPPTKPETNTSMWCAINSDVYEPEPSGASGNVPKRRDWGYCLEVLSVSPPTDGQIPTVAPTVQVIEPTTQPTTPGTEEPTGEDHEGAVVYYGSGGGVGVNTADAQLPCVFPFTIKGIEDENAQEIEFMSCVSFDLYQPYQQGDSVWEGPMAPAANANRSSWCSVIGDRYNIDPQNEPSNKYNWGYCLEVLAVVTDAPTTDDVTVAPTGLSGDSYEYYEYNYEYGNESEWNATFAPTSDEERPSSAGKLVASITIMIVTAVIAVATA